MSESEEEKKPRRQICTHSHDPRAEMCRVCSNKMLRHATTAPAIDRFMAKTDRSGLCWTWQGSINGGYGKFRPVAAATPVLAHRFAYQYFRGEIPQGLTLDHLCRNTRCVNPYHLEPVTRSVNVRRAKAVLSGS